MQATRGRLRAGATRAADALETLAAGGDQPRAGVGARRRRRRRAEVGEHVVEAIRPQRDDARRRVEQRPRRLLDLGNDTAHTSHCSWVTIRSGRAARSASSSMR